jgi:DNA-binding NtrC family response regulator
VPAAGPGGQRVWDVEFLPLQGSGRFGGVVGRVIPRTEVTPPAATPLPERLIDLRQRCKSRFGYGLLDSSAPAMRRLTEQVRLATAITASVLLTGEAGTGKETLGRLIHYGSDRGESALAALDCARLPAEAIQRLLFGESLPPGQPGAIYLREPSALPRDLQVRLCALIASGTGPRILAGCRSDPGEQVRSGRLLDDLYASFPLVLEVPPLRQRTEDLAALIERILERAGEGGGGKVGGLTAAAGEMVAGHSWPGNLSELSAVLSAARRRARGALIDATDLPASMRLRQAAGTTPPPERPLPLDALLEQAERRLIELALRRAKGHRGRAAEILGIWRPRLLRRLEALGLAGTGTKDDAD